MEYGNRRSKIQEEASGTSEENIIFYRNYRGVISDSDNIFSCSDASKSTGMVYDSLSLCCVRSCCAESCDFPETEKDRRPLRIVIPETDDIFIRKVSDSELTKRAVLQ